MRSRRLAMGKLFDLSTEFFKPALSKKFFSIGKKLILLFTHMIPTAYSFVLLRVFCRQPARPPAFRSGWH